MSFFYTVKQLFFLLIIILVTPALLRAIKQQYTALSQTKAQVAILPIRGIITESLPIVALLKRSFEDSSVKAILLTIDCPGAAAGTAEAIFAEIESLKRHNPKPVVGLIENACTAGGYWIACAADYLIAPGTALIGEISGTFKHDTTRAEHNGPQSAAIQEDRYQQFAHLVARSRKLSIAKLEQWANGNLFTGQQALKLHLIDALGSASNATEIIKQKALIEGEIEWVRADDQYAWLCDIIS